MSSAPSVRLVERIPESRSKPGRASIGMGRDAAYPEELTHCSRPLSLADHDADPVNADSACHLKRVAGSSPEGCFTRSQARPA